MVCFTFCIVYFTFLEMVGTYSHVAIKKNFFVPGVPHERYNVVPHVLWSLRISAGYIAEIFMPKKRNGDICLLKSKGPTGSQEPRNPRQKIAHVRPCIPAKENPPQGKHTGRPGKTGVTFRKRNGFEPGPTQVFICLVPSACSYAGTHQGIHQGIHQNYKCLLLPVIKLRVFIRFCKNYILYNRIMHNYAKTTYG